MPIAQIPQTYPPSLLAYILSKCIDICKSNTALDVAVFQAS